MGRRRRGHRHGSMHAPWCNAPAISGQQQSCTSPRQKTTHQALPRWEGFLTSSSPAKQSREGACPRPQRNGRGAHAPQQTNQMSRQPVTCTGSARSRPAQRGKTQPQWAAIIQDHPKWQKHGLHVLLEYRTARERSQQRVLHRWFPTWIACDTATIACRASAYARLQCTKVSEPQIASVALFRLCTHAR